MAVTSPVSSDSAVIVTDTNPTAVYNAAPGTGAFVAVNPTGAAADATLVQWYIEPAGGITFSLDGTNTLSNIAGVDAPLVIWAKAPIYVKGSATVSVKIVAYQLGGRVE